MQEINSVVKAKRSPVNNKTSKLPREYQQFEALINDNIDDNIIVKHIRKDALNYFPIKIEHGNPSMSVMIQKKKTHTQIAQHLHASCFPPVRSTRLKAINKSNIKT